MDVFPMPEVTVECKVLDWIVLAADGHGGYIVAVPGNKTGGTSTEWDYKPRPWPKRWSGIG